MRSMSSGLDSLQETKKTQAPTLSCHVLPLSHVTPHNEPVLKPGLQLVTALLQHLTFFHEHLLGLLKFMLQSAEQRGTGAQA